MHSGGDHARTATREGSSTRPMRSRLGAIWYAVNPSVNPATSQPRADPWFVTPFTPFLRFRAKRQHSDKSDLRRLRRPAVCNPFHFVPYWQKNGTISVNVSEEFGSESAAEVLCLLGLAS